MKVSSNKVNNLLQVQGIIEAKTDKHFFKVMSVIPFFFNYYFEVQSLITVD